MPANIGDKYGRLLVVTKSKKDIKGNAYWICLCDCGNTKVVRGSHLLSGNVKSCGCLRHVSPANHTDWTGKSINGWRIIKKAGQKRNGEFYYTCKCECGKEINLTRKSIKRGAGHCGCKSTRGLNCERNLIYNNLMNGAKKRGLCVDLTRDEIYEMSLQNCFYCGEPPVERRLSKVANPKSRRVYCCNGIDRVDNSVGYINGNCRPCCFMCNRAKATMPVDVFESWAMRVGANIAKRKHAEAY